MDYFVWERDEDDDSLAWIFSFPKEITRKKYLLLDGVSVKDWFPDDLIIDLYKEKGIKLSDAIPNYDLIWVISEKLKKILEKESAANIEYFPVRIRDHKGHIVKKPYFIANLLDTVECVDMQKSDYRMDPIIKTQVDRFFRIVLDEKKIDQSKQVFRLKEKTNLVLIDDNLSDAILEADCTGMVFQELDDYGSLFRDDDEDEE